MKYVLSANACLSVSLCALRWHDKPFRVDTTFLLSNSLDRSMINGNDGLINDIKGRIYVIHDYKPSETVSLIILSMACLYEKIIW